MDCNHSEVNGDHFKLDGDHFEVDVATLKSLVSHLK